MKTITLFILVSAAFIGISYSQSSLHNAQYTSDPLDQWNEGTAKASILSFVNAVTDKTSPKYLSEADRVAVFDMDGTILLEKPNPVNFDVIIRLMVEQMSRNPSLTQKKPYKAIHEQNWAYFDTLGYYGDDGLFSILLNATVGYTEDQYSDFILKYFNTVKDKRFNKTYNHLVYVPVV